VTIQVLVQELSRKGGQRAGTLQAQWERGPVPELSALVSVTNCPGLVLGAL
jgi:hypothetical protein